MATTSYTTDLSTSNVAFSATVGGCGGCTECCTLLPINDADLQKAVGETCVHCEHGCTIYKERPNSCRAFNCVYIESDSLPIDLRPDKTHVIFEKITTNIYLALVDPNYPDALAMKNIDDYINQLNVDGISVIASSFNNSNPMVKAAAGHNPRKVYEIAMEVYRGGS